MMKTLVILFGLVALASVATARRRYDNSRFIQSVEEEEARLVEAEETRLIDEAEALLAKVKEANSPQKRIMCPMCATPADCPYGYGPSNGCPPCRCYEPCANVTCPPNMQQQITKWTTNGVVYACCSCVCNPMACAAMCPQPMVKDENGCCTCSG